MGGADEVAQQAALVDPARKAADTPPPDEIAPFPIALRNFVQTRGEMLAVKAEIG